MTEKNQILILAARHGVLTVDAVKAVLFKGKSESAARKALEAATKNGLLKTFKLDGKQNGYLLSKNAVNQLSLPRSFAAVLGERVLAERLSVLRYASQSGRTLLLREEYNCHFKELVAENVPFEYCTYYVREDKNGASLHRFIVDLGATPKRAAERIAAFLQKTSTSPTLTEMVETGAFGFTVIVPSPTKRDALRKVFNGGPFLNGYRVDVEITVVQNLIAKPSSKKSK